MNYQLIRDLVQLAEDFGNRRRGVHLPDNIEGFRAWIGGRKSDISVAEPDWEGKQNGRSAESVINTLILHMNRYAKTYSKAAIHGSAFSTQEEFIYLINLKAFGAMSKTELIRKNVQDKPTGIQIINRLIQEGWVVQRASRTDKRSRIIELTRKGLLALERQMEKIREATRIVTGDLTQEEKMELIRLLDKLDRFHQPIFSRNLAAGELLDTVRTEYMPIVKS